MVGEMFKWGQQTKQQLWIQSLQSAGLLTVAVEECDVDAATFVGVLKVDGVGFVEEIGIENDRAVLAMWNRNRFGAMLLEKLLNLVFVLVVVVFGKVPIIRGFLIPDHKTSIL